MSDAAVPAGGNVEIGVSCGLELGGCRPCGPAGTERFELSADAIGSPSPLRGGLVGEHVPRGGPATDANQQTRRDELGEVLRSLGTAHTRDTLVLAPCQRRTGVCLECQQRSLLSWSELGFPARGAVRHGDPPPNGTCQPTIAHDTSVHQQHLPPEVRDENCNRSFAVRTYSGSRQKTALPADRPGALT
jgi:hypothetical protein